MLAGNETLSARGASMRGDSTLLFTGYILAQKNPYSNENPGGCINLGTSENKLMFDLLSEKFNDASCRHVEESSTMYGDHTGVVTFRDEIAGLFNRTMHPKQPVAASELCVMTGAGTVVEALAFSLCDAGDGILIPTPYYGGFDMDLNKRAGVIPCPIDTTPETNFALTDDALEGGWNAAVAKGIRVRGLIVCSPNNPLGTVYTRTEMQSCLDFCHRHDIHCIFDELYYLSTYEQESADASFVPVLSMDSIPDHSRLHVVWSFSKDFSISGFRVGVVHTRNPELSDVLGQMSYFTGVSIPTQHLLRNALRDTEWVDRYTATMHTRLKEGASIVTNALDAIHAPYVRPSAGFFIWTDLGRFLPSRTVDNELSLWRRLIEAGLYIAPGEAFHCVQPGWFRIVFADNKDVMGTAMLRLMLFLDKEASGLSASNAHTGHEAAGSILPGDRLSEEEKLSTGGTSEPSLEDLVSLLKGQIRTSDWLQSSGDVPK
eukprot:Opistho-2@23071